MSKSKFAPLGNLVRSLREGKGWSQKELSDKSGVLRAEIAEIEGGEIEQVGEYTLRSLARALDVTMESLLVELRK